MGSNYVVLLTNYKINITNTLVKMLVCIFVTTIIEVCTEIANGYENKQRDHGYTQEQVKRKTE